MSMYPDAFDEKHVLVEVMDDLLTGHFPMLTMPVELADLLESLLPV